MAASPRPFSPRQPLGVLRAQRAPITLSRGLGLQRFGTPLRAFGAWRTLTQVVQRTIAQSAARHWSAWPSAIHAWHRVVTHNPWLGRGSQMDYRLRRARIETATGPVVARQAARPAEVEESFSSFAPAEPFESDITTPFAAPEFDFAPDQPQTFARETEFADEVALPSMTVALPDEWFSTAAATPENESEQANFAPAAPRVFAQRPIAQATPLAQEPMVARRVQRTALTQSESISDSVSPIAPRVDEQPVTSRQVPLMPQSEVSETRQPARIIAQGEVPTPIRASVPLTETAHEAASPAWPFTFVTPSIARATVSAQAADDIADTTPFAPSIAAAPLVVRRMALPTPIAQAAAGVPALMSPVRPAGQMLMHIPPTELDLGQSVKPLVQRTEAMPVEATSIASAQPAPVYRIAQSRLRPNEIVPSETSREASGTTRRLKLFIRRLRLPRPPTPSRYIRLSRARGLSCLTSSAPLHPKRRTRPSRPPYKSCAGAARARIVRRCPFCRRSRR